MEKMVLVWRPDEWFYPKPKWLQGHEADQVIMRTTRLSGGARIGMTGNVPKWVASSVTAVCREVWNSLPKVDRNAIIDYWLTWGKPDDLPYGGFTFTGSPIESQNGMSLVNGQVMQEGHSILIVAGVPDLHFVIAHELAHCYLYATEHPSHARAETDMSWGEVEADAVAARWGYVRSNSSEVAYV